MGNYFQTNRNNNLFKNQHRDIWIRILQFLDLKSLLNFSICSKKTREISKSELIWKNLSQTSKHWERILSRKEQFNFSWLDSFIFCWLECIKTIEIPVGPPNNPDYYVLLQLIGNGVCFISNSYYRGFFKVPKNDEFQGYYIGYNGTFYEMIPITEFEPVLSNKKYIPGTQEWKENRLINQESKKIKISKIVDLINYHSCIILLSEDNRIFELILTPSWVEGYKKYPEEVILPLDQTEDILKVRITQIGTFVLTKNKVIFWTFLDNKTKTKPVIIHPLSRYNIIDIGNIDDKIIEFIYFSNHEEIIRVSIIELFTCINQN